MPYKPCQFDRKNYLDNAPSFEAVNIDDADQELCEFSNDAEDLAFELAYTRYKMMRMEEAMLPFISLMRCSKGRIAAEMLSASDWHKLLKAYELFEA